MLLDLPPELIIDITLYLNISEKLQLVLTCKKLKDAILEECLYETLDKTLNKSNAESIVLYFQKNRSRGQQVKFLRINLDSLTDQLYSAIPLIFPNVVNFRDFYQQKYRPNPVSSGFLKWKDTITCLDHDDAKKEVGVIYELLEKNVFSRLTSLEVKPSRKKGDGHIDLLECIKNAPALERLDILYFNLTLNDLETIHSACPRLATFEMTGCGIIVTESDHLPNEIKPALRLSRLSLLVLGIYDQQCLFLAYLTQKYTKLIKLQLLIYPKSSFPKNQYLNRLNHKFDFTERKEELVVTHESYCKSASNILSTLPSTLRMLTFEMFGTQDLMTIFSESCVNITRLEFFSFVLSSPEDIKMFKNLPFLKYVCIALDPSLQEYKQIPASTSVTQLKLVISPVSSHNNDMDIGWILSMFPSLTDLTIENQDTPSTKSKARLVGSDNNLLTQHHHLSRLSLGFDATHSNLLNFIRATAPNLKELFCFIPVVYFEEQIEDYQKNQAIAPNINEPTIENDILNFAIDLTGFSLNLLYLKARFFIMMDYTKKDILLELKNKGGTSTDFIISDDDPKQVYSTKYSTEDARENVKAKIKVQYDYIKTIALNSAVTIDLESQQVLQK